MEVLTFCIDMDGTICEIRGHHYTEHTPRPDVISKINKLFTKGHHIVIFTGRGTRTGTDWRELTEKQLKQWGVNYHQILFGKPHADYFIDDRAINIEDWIKEAE